MSAQSGVVVLNEGDLWFVVRPPDYAPRSSTPAAGLTLLNGSTDIQEVALEDAQDAEFALRTARARDNALRYVLMLLEEPEIGEFERRLLDRLRDLSLYEVNEFVLNRLYAAPLPPESIDRARIMIRDFPFHPISGILSQVVAAQEDIARVKSAWEIVSAGRFEAPDDGKRFFSEAVESGLVRRLANGIFDMADQPGKYGPLMEAWWETAGNSVWGRLPLCSPGRLVDSPHRNLKIAMLGPTGSGKSCLLAAIFVGSSLRGICIADFPGTIPEPAVMPISFHDYCSLTATDFTSAEPRRPEIGDLITSKLDVACGYLRPALELTHKQIRNAAVLFSHHAAIVYIDFAVSPNACGYKERSLEDLTIAFRRMIDNPGLGTIKTEKGISKRAEINLSDERFWQNLIRWWRQQELDHGPPLPGPVSSPRT